MSDLDQIPAADELYALRRGKRGRLFNAYVNLGSLNTETIRAIAMANQHALFVVTKPD